jgi:Holliday junction resolvasome RuvABC endonuclease subunit
MIILSLDQASETGYALLDTDGCRLLDYGVETFDMTHTQGWVELKEFLASLIYKFNVDVVVFEEPHINPKRIKSNIALSKYAGGIIMLCAAVLHVRVAGLYPSQVRKASFGKGNMKKEEVRVRTNDIFNIKLKNKNITDAIAIGVAYLSMIINEQGEVV